MTFRDIWPLIRPEAVSRSASAPCEIRALVPRAVGPLPGERSLLAGRGGNTAPDIPLRMPPSVALVQFPGLRLPLLYQGTATYLEFPTVFLRPRIGIHVQAAGRYERHPADRRGEALGVQRAEESRRPGRGMRPGRRGWVTDKA